MKRKIIALAMLLILSFCLLCFTGCTFTAEAQDNTVTLSVDEETSGTVNNIIDWIKERLDRVFDVEVKTEVKKDSVTVTTGSSEKI